MRTIKHRTKSFLIVALGVALASTSFADNKKGGSKPAGGAKGGAAGGAAGGGAGGGSGGGGGDEGIEIDQPAGGGSGGGSDSGTIDMEAPEEQPAGSLEAELSATETQQTVKSGPVQKTPLSWKDILVVVRKPFLKVRRTELNPFVATTMNDNMITHYGIGGEFAYYLTDVLAVGVEGQYFIHNFGEPFDLVARQARRLPTVSSSKSSGSARRCGSVRSTP